VPLSHVSSYCFRKMSTLLVTRDRASTTAGSTRDASNTYPHAVACVCRPEWYCRCSLLCLPPRPIRFSRRTIPTALTTPATSRYFRYCPLTRPCPEMTKSTRMTLNRHLGSKKKGIARFSLFPRFLGFTGGLDWSRGSAIISMLIPHGNVVYFFVMLAPSDASRRTRITRAPFPAV
jgi:hypothetical protein